jgi:hypothetical protein
LSCRRERGQEGWAGLAEAINGRMRGAGRPLPNEATQLVAGVAAVGESLGDLSEALAVTESARMGRRVSRGLPG